eukprot:222614-Hanusia_phi.AAC.1
MERMPMLSSALEIATGRGRQGLKGRRRKRRRRRRRRRRRCHWRRMRRKEREREQDEEQDEGGCLKHLQQQDCAQVVRACGEERPRACAGRESLRWERRGWRGERGTGSGQGNRRGGRCKGWACESR